MGEARSLGTSGPLIAAYPDTAGVFATSVLGACAGTDSVQTDDVLFGSDGVYRTLAALGKHRCFLRDARRINRGGAQQIFQARFEAAGEGGPKLDD